MWKVGFLAAVALGLLLAAPGERLNEAPSAVAAEMTTNHARLEAVSFDGQGTVGEPLVSEASNFTSFSDGIEAFDDPNEGRSGDAEAFQNTTVNFTDQLAPVIHTMGATEATWTDGETNDGKNPSASGRSQFTITFETPSEATFRLTGLIEATRSGSNTSCAGVTVTSPDGATIQVSSCGSNQQDIDRSGDLAAGTHTFSVVAIAAASNPGALGGTALATFNINLAVTERQLIDEVEFTQAAQKVQSTSALKADLETDGAPPVPIVAGKPAAMRVYFKEVEEPVTYVVDSNLTAEDITVTLLPGCDEIERRAQKDTCESVDFYFLPPVGDYEADVIVKTVTGDVVEEHTFPLTSKRSPQLTLVAVSICDNQIAPYVWDCGDQTKVDRLASFLRAVAPTDKVEVRRHNAVVMRELPQHPTVLVGSEWYWGVRDQVEALYVADQAAGLLPTGKVIYVGVTREGLPVPYYGLGGTHSLVFGTAASPQGVDVAQEILAHEVGHVLGANHTNSDQPRSDTRPGCYAMAVEPTPDWPEPDNFLYTVGFDTITGDAKPGTEWFELMGYCGPQWISTHTTLKMLAGLNPPATASVSSASTSGDGWLISGTISEGAVTFAPLLERGDLAPSASSDGQYTLEVRGAGDAVLSAHAFDATAGEPVIKEGVTPPDAAPFFSIVVPTQAGAESIVVLEGSDELGALQLTGAPPTVVFDTLPGSPISGEQQVSWTITDTDSSAQTSWLEYSRDAGATWVTIAAALADNGLTVDFDALGGSDNAMLRVLVSNGPLTGAATTEVFGVGEKGPEASIVAPTNGTAYRVTEIVGLQAAAFDPEGDVTVTWSSSRDGNLGAGPTLPVEGLSTGTHTITMTAKDSDNNTLTDTVTVSVSDAPIVEGEPVGSPYVWGDNDCNGAISSRDSQALTRNILGQPPLSQTQPCPAMGAMVTVGGASLPWGDLDCSGAISARDGQALLRETLGQNPLSQTQPCPPIGDTVTVATSAALVGGVRWRALY